MILRNFLVSLALKIPPHLVSNTYAKQILEASESKEDIFDSPRGLSGSGHQVIDQTEKVKTGARKTRQ